MLSYLLLPPFYLFQIHVAATKSMILTFHSSTIAIDSTCRGDCQCSQRYYKPICTEADEMTYFSACHAGCDELVTNGEKKVLRRSLVELN